MKKLPINPQTYIYSVATLLIILVVYIIAKKTGIIRPKVIKKAAKELDSARAETKEDRAEKKTITKTLTTTAIFDPTTYKKVVKPRLLTVSSAQKCAKFLNDNLKGADDEEAIYGLFRKLTAIEQISQISDVYFGLYKEDLSTRLAKDLTKNEMQQLWQIINSKFE
jgi:hypothetical protein